MPIDYKTYHPDWKSIARQIREQADDQCEFCGVPNKSYGARDRHGEWHTEDDIEGMNSDVGESLFGDFPKLITIVLTVAHLCHNERCIDPVHLRSLCQRCHNRYDTKHRSANAAATRRHSKMRGQLAFDALTTLPAYDTIDIDTGDCLVH